MPDADVLPWVAPTLARLLPLESVFDPRTLTEGALGWLGTQLRRCDDPAFAARFAGMQTATGAPADAFLHRIVNVGDAAVLGGIRFYGGDAARPFVDIFAWTATPDWDALAAAVRREWAVFAPGAMRVVLPAPPAGAAWRLDQGIHAGRVGAMPLPAADGVSLQAAEDPAEAAAFVADAYSHVIASQPALDGEILAADAETLADCRAAGTLFWIMAGAVRAGLIATLPGEIEMLAGDIIIEETVGPDFRGRGLAARAQGLLAADLAARDSARVLMGTIFAGNEASRRTAAAAGRPARLSYWFADLPA